MTKERLTEVDKEALKEMQKEFFEWAHKLFKKMNKEREQKLASTDKAVNHD